LNENNFNGDSLILGTGGKPNLHFASGKFSASNDCFVIKPKKDDEIHPKFLYYYFLNKMYLLENGFRGAGLKHLSRSYLNDLPIPIFDYHTAQLRIINILDKADALRQKRKESIKLLDDFLRSTFLEMFGDPKVNNKNMVTDTLGNIATIVMGQSPPGSSYNNDGDGKPLLNGPAEFGKKFPLEKQWTTQPKKFSEKRDILFCVRGATAGRMNWSDKDYCIGRGLAAIRTKSNISNSFIHSFLEFMYLYFQNTSDGSTFINISSDVLNNLKILIPDTKDEEKYSSINKQVEKLKAKYKESEKELNNLFGSLMQRAFKGELT